MDLTAEPAGGRQAQGHRRALFTFVLVLLASLPVLVGVSERLHDGWQPQGDDAFIAWLAHDALTRDPPLLGMPTTIGFGPGDDVETSPPHHWGPMEFWVLAIPQRSASDDPAGLQVGLLAFEIATIAGIVLFSLRRSGRLGALTLLVPLAAATWSLGRVVLSSIWNPDAALLPVAFLLVVTWACAEGDPLALPFAALAASFVAQSNILYTPLVASLLAWGVVGFAIARREQRAAGGDRARLRRPLIATLAVLLVCWSTAIIEEVTHRPGNIERVLQHAFGEGGDHVGFARATHVIARTIGGVPFWSHPLDSERDVIGLLRRPSLFVTTTAVAFGLLLLTGLARTWRRSPSDRALLGTAACGLIGSTLIAALLPLSFGLAPYRLRGLWITGAFAIFAVARFAALSVAPMLTGVSRARARRGALAGLTLLLAAFATLGATGWRQTSQGRDSSGVVDDLARSTAANLTGHGPYLAVEKVSPLSGIAAGVLWGLERRGFDIRFSNRPASYTETYVAEIHGAGERSMPRLVLMDKASGYRPRPGERLVARVAGSAGARRLTERSRSKLCDALEADPPAITEDAAALLASRVDDGNPPDSSAYVSGALGCEVFDHVARLTSLTERDAAVLGMSPDQWTALRGFATAKYNLKREDFAVYVRPAP